MLVLVAFPIRCMPCPLHSCSNCWEYAVAASNSSRDNTITFGDLTDIPVKVTEMAGERDRIGTLQLL